MKNNIPELVKKYSEQLDSVGIEHKILTHPELRTPPEVLAHLGLELSDGSSTLIMKADDNFVAIIRRDDCKLNLQRFRDLLKVNSLRMANPDEFKELTGLPLGAARVYNPGIKTYVDKKVLDKEYVTGGSGTFTETIKYKTSDLLKIPNSATIDVSELSVVTADGLSGLGETRRRRRVLSGMRASGRLHLGNYLGGAKGMLELQNNPAYETLYMVADVHGITAPYDVKHLQENKRGMLLDYLSVGLDPEKSVVFMQSDIPEHLELAFYFSSVVSMYRMQHLPTFKDEVKKHPDNVTMALLGYPVLMASDILIYNASLVPVGIDQEPHLEIAREIARKMNDTYGTKFPEPVRFATSGEYVPSLSGEGKMSKSVEGSYISLTDDLKTIQKRLAGAPTDSGKGETVPTSGGVANLLKFVELFEGIEKRKMYEEKYMTDGIRYGDLKKELADAIYKELLPIQEKRKELEHKTSYVDEVIKSGAEKARKIASETVLEVKEKMGLL